jgi:hypothetical protein
MALASPWLLLRRHADAAQDPANPSPAAAASTIAAAAASDSSST